MNKIYFMFLLPVLFAVLFSANIALAKNENSYVINNKFVRINIDLFGPNDFSGLRPNEGIIDLSIKYKKPHEKFLTLNFYCPENNYESFNDLCNQTFYTESEQQRFHYLLTNEDEKYERKMTLQFSFGEPEYFKDILIPTPQKPEIKVIAPKKGKSFKEGDYVNVAWEPFGGNVSKYSVRLANKLFPNRSMMSRPVDKNSTNYQYFLSVSEFSYSTIIDNFIVNYKGENLPSRKNIAKNFYLEVDAWQGNDPWNLERVATGNSPTFKIKE